MTSDTGETVLLFRPKCNTLDKDAMIFDRIEWDEHNLDHATMRLTAAEIEQALWNSDRMRQHPNDPERGRIESATDGGKAVVIIVQILRDGVRPITGWEARQ